MSGHGWVIPLRSGARARCGGPAICPICAEEARLMAHAEKIVEREIDKVINGNHEVDLRGLWR
jgi:hypothetical protein